MDFEMKRDKSKTFKMTEETLKAIEQQIKFSGKGPTEFFEDLVQDLKSKKILDENNKDISADLRNHFQSDVQKMKNATSSILSIFISQMENITVEKDKWTIHLDQQLKERDDKIDAEEKQIEELKQQLKERAEGLTESKKTNDMLQTERDALFKRTEDQEQMIRDRNEKIDDLTERVNKLNENIIDKDEELKQIVPIRQEKQQLNTQNQALSQEIDKLKQQHKGELEKKEEELIFECEKTKHKLQSYLVEGFQKEKEKVREATRKDVEKSTRDFYVTEIERRDQEYRLKEQALQTGISDLERKDQENRLREETLQKEIEGLKQQIEESNNI